MQFTSAKNHWILPTHSNVTSKIAVGFTLRKFTWTTLYTRAGKRLGSGQEWPTVILYTAHWVQFQSDVWSCAWSCGSTSVTSLRTAHLLRLWDAVRGRCNKMFHSLEMRVSLKLNSRVLGDTWLIPLFDSRYFDNSCKLRQLSLFSFLLYLCHTCQMNNDC